VADEAERELERAAQRGDSSAEAELLRRQLRTGAVSKRALGRAAALGHEPSRLALGLEEPSREDWIGFLHYLPLSGAVRAALTALRATDAEGCGLGWDLAAAWARSPRPKHHAAARAAFEEGALPLRELTLLAGLVRSDRGRLQRLVEEVGADVPDLREQIRADLVPWLLGRRDPLGPTE
jgi:hypothetical protein